MLVQYCYSFNNGKQGKKKLTANGVILLTGKQQLGFQTPAIFFFLLPYGCMQHLLLL